MQSIGYWQQWKFVIITNRETRTKIDSFDTSCYRATKDTELIQKMQTSLSQLKLFNNQQLPHEIVSIIISMLPSTHPLTEQYTQQFLQKKTMITSILTSTQFIYPIIRFIANFINFICIIIRYVSWYEQNLHFSNWRKYNAFIIAMLYMPNLKGRGAMSCFAVGMVDPWPVVFTVSMCMISVCVCNVYLVIFSLPLLGSARGWFVYITTGLLALFFMGILILVFDKIFDKIERKYNINASGFDVQRIFAPIVMCATMVLYFAWATQIISMMEYFDGIKWSDAYRFGLYGEYCQKDDYFQWDKWSEYSWDIQFLVIGWFVF